MNFTHLIVGSRIRAGLILKKFTWVKIRLNKMIDTLLDSVF